MDDDAKRRSAEDFVAGLVQGDVHRMRAALREDATWSVPGETAISGTARGAEAIVGRARTIASTDDLSVRPDHVLFGLDKVAVALHNTGRRGEVELDERVFIVLTLIDGKIAAADNLVSDVAGLNAFFAAGTN